MIQQIRATLELLTNNQPFSTNFINNLPVHQLYGRTDIRGIQTITQIPGRFIYRDQEEVSRIILQSVRQFISQIEQSYYQQLEEQTTPITELTMDVINDAALRLAEEGGSPDTLIVSLPDYNALQIDLGPHNTQIHTPVGALNVESSPFVNESYILDSNSFQRHQFGDTIQSEVLQSPTICFHEVRLSNYSRLQNSRPDDAGFLTGLQDSINASINRMYDNISQQMWGPLPEVNYGEPENQNRNTCLYCDEPLITIDNEKVCLECDDSKKLREMLSA
jgi:hypothetical protein